MQRAGASPNKTMNGFVGNLLKNRSVEKGTVGFFSMRVFGVRTTNQVEFF